MDHKQFLPVHMSQGWRRSWIRSIFITSASCTRDSGKTGSEEVLFTSASVLDKEEKLDQKHFLPVLPEEKLI
jgi:hypothetical protein